MKRVLGLPIRHKSSLKGQDTNFLISDLQHYWLLTSQIFHVYEFLVLQLAVP